MTEEKLQIRDNEGDMISSNQKYGNDVTSIRSSNIKQKALHFDLNKIEVHTETDHKSQNLNVMLTDSTHEMLDSWKPDKTDVEQECMVHCLVMLIGVYLIIV